ncbi:MAG: dephospho-CoA kinase [Candidatus Aminicenantes bacterium]|nr:dephospho-CoA kinase [Candidatus Aminicenantes bacterium]
MLLVALTGGIATGKSVVANILKEKGCYVQNADQLAHELMQPETPVWKNLVHHFGRGLLKEDGSIDREKLSSIVFHDEEEREYLNQITHPAVLEKIRLTITALEQENKYEIYITEAALVIEAGYQDFYDRLILTHCSPEIQLARLIRRNGLTEEQARARLQAQLPDKKKKPYAHYLIDTSGSLEETIEQTERVYFRLYQEALLKKIGQLVR